MSLQNGNMGANTHDKYRQKHNMFSFINELLDFMVVPFYMGSFASIFSTLLLRQGISSSGLKMLIKLGGALLYASQGVFFTCLAIQIVGAIFFTKEFRNNLLWHWSRSLCDDKGFVHFVRAVRNVFLARSVLWAVRLAFMPVADPLLPFMIATLALFYLMSEMVAYDNKSMRDEGNDFTWMGFVQNNMILLYSFLCSCSEFFFMRQSVSSRFGQGIDTSVQPDDAYLSEDQGADFDELNQDGSFASGSSSKNVFSFFKEEEGCAKGNIALRFTHALSGIAASLLAGLDDDAFGVLPPVGS